mgnify:CR=1 FL=1
MSTVIPPVPASTATFVAAFIKANIAGSIATVYVVVSPATESETTIPVPGETMYKLFPSPSELPPSPKTGTGYT